MKKLNLLFTFIAMFALPNLANAAHGPSTISDFDHTGMGSFSGTYTHSSTDHVWFIFNANAGDTIKLNGTTAYESYVWLYASNNNCLQVGTSPGSNPNQMTLINSSYTVNSFTYSFILSSSGQFAIQLDAFIGQSGVYNVVLSGATASYSYCPGISFSHSEPRDTAVCAGANVKFIVSVIGTLDSLKWQRNTGSAWTYIANSTDSTLTLNNVSASMNGYLYRCIFTYSGQKDTSDAATLTVYALASTALTSSRNPSTNGYAPYQCTNLKANATGFGSLGISWAHGPTADSIQACPTVGQWYKVTVTDGHGCIKKDSIRQFVVNASTPYPGYSLICYNYPRRPYYYTLTVQQSQVPYYLGLGATLGACGSTPSKRGEEATFAGIADLYNYYPNPMSNTLNVEWFNLFTEEVSIDVLDMTGKVVKTLYNAPVVEGELSNLQADMMDLNNGMYLLRFSSNSDYRINKIQVIR